MVARQLYDRHLGDTRARLEELLAPLCPGPIELQASPIDDGFRGQARFSVDVADGRPEVTGVDPVAGRGPWRSTLWILPAFARRMVEAIVGQTLADYPRHLVRGFELRVGCGTEQGHLVVAVDRAEPGSYEEWAARLLRDVPRLSGVSIPSHGVELGEELITHRLLGRELLSHPLAFFQTNYRLTEALVERVASLVSSGAPAAILDLYCGVGVHSLLAGDQHTKVLGIDSDRHAIAVANRNAERAGREAVYERAPVGRFLADVTPPRADVVIVNPTRAGCGSAVVDRIAALAPASICLVCCSVEAHARDLERFRSGGYDAVEHTSFDMFPFSPFVENVTRLVRR